MMFQRYSNGQIIYLSHSSYLGRGGEGEVYKAGSNLVAKIYHNPANVPLAKLTAMLCNPPDDPMRGYGHNSIAWPIDLLQAVDGSKRIAGFLMPFVGGMVSLDNVYIPKNRRQHYPLFNYLYLHRTARNIAAAVSALHARGYIIGDISGLNIRVAANALVTMIDTDSFQVREPRTGMIHRGRVGTSEFTPPELQGTSLRTVDRTLEHDHFGLAVLIFLLLMEGTHPFAGVYIGQGEVPPIEARIAAGHFPHSNARCSSYRPKPDAPPLEILNPGLRHLFIRCFVDGHNDPGKRPDAQTWLNALEKAENA